MKLFSVILTFLVAKCSFAAGPLQPKAHTPSESDLQKPHSTFNNFADYDDGLDDQPALVVRDATPQCDTTQKSVKTAPGDIRGVAKNFCNFLGAFVFTPGPKTVWYIVDQWLCIDTSTSNATECGAYVALNATSGMHLSLQEFQEGCPKWLGHIDDECPQGGSVWDETKTILAEVGYTPNLFRCVDEIDVCVWSPDPPPAPGGAFSV